MSGHRTVILKKDVRTLTRSEILNNSLSSKDIRWLRKGAKVVISEPLEMDYDHDTKVVVRLIGYSPDRFIILSELGEMLSATISPKQGMGEELSKYTVTITFKQIGKDYTASISFNTIKQSQVVKSKGSFTSLCEQIEAHIQRTLTPSANFSLEILASAGSYVNYTEITILTNNIMNSLNSRLRR